MTSNPLAATVRVILRANYRGDFTALLQSAAKSAQRRYRIAAQEVFTPVRQRVTLASWRSANKRVDRL